MKKLFFIAALFAVILSSCEKEDDPVTYSNYVRITNSHSQSLNCILAGVDFGTVASGTTTAYKVVPGGTNPLGGQLTGTITLPDVKTLVKDKRFTVTIAPDGGISIAEDL